MVGRPLPLQSSHSVHAPNTCAIFLFTACDINKKPTSAKTLVQLDFWLLGAASSIMELQVSKEQQRNRRRPRISGMHHRFLYHFMIRTRQPIAYGHLNTERHTSAKPPTDLDRMIFHNLICSLTGTLVRLFCVRQSIKLSLQV